MYETLVINGVDLAEVVTCIQSLDGLYNIGTPRGDNVIFPGVDGEMFVDKAFATGTMELGLFLAGSTTTQFNDGLRTLRAAAPPNRLLALERRLSYTSGNETQVALGEYLSGLNPTLQLMRFGKTTLAVKILDGLWYASSPTNITIPGGSFTPIVIGGEARTHKMLLTMSPGSTVTNTTTSHTVSNTATGGEYVIVDVEAMTATQAGVDVSNSLVWNRRYPMRFNPGPNDFVGDGCLASYTAAYL